MAGGSCGPIRPAPALFGAANAAALAEKTFGPADRHRRQIARLAGRLLANGAIRLERLQGFGAAPGMLATCGCFAARFSRWQPRRSDRRRQHRADRAATGADAPDNEMQPSRSHIIRASLVRAGLDPRQSCRASAAERAPSSSNRSRRNRLADRPAAGTIGRSARRVCVVRCVCRTCRRRRAARGRNHSACGRNHRARATTCHRSVCRGRAAGAPPAAALHLADGSGRPLHARHQRIHRLDRPAHHGRFRPAMARDRRDLRIRSHRPDDAGLRDAAPPGAASR